MKLPIAAPDIKAIQLSSGHSIRSLAERSPQPVPDSQKKMAIINTANRPWAVIDSMALFDCCSDMQIQEYYFSPGGRPFEQTGLALDAAMVSVGSSEQLVSAITDCTPSIIYLRVSPHTRSEFLISSIRLAFPSIPLVVEFYDASCHFNEEALSYIFPDDSAIAAALQACAVGFHYADAVVLKMGGEAFGVWAEGIERPLIPFFPSVSDVQLPSVRSTDTRRRVLYAGSISARELEGGFGSVHGANFAGYFDAFFHSDHCSLEIVNAAHTSLDEDKSAKFAGLLERYGANSGHENIVYRRAMPRHKLIEYAASFDVGICCGHYVEDVVMDVTRFGLPNRMMSYLAAGLPVVIDDRFEYAAGLIEQFGAGTVVPAGKFDVFMRSIVELDLVRASAGVEALVRHMKQENEDVFLKLQTLAEGESFFLKTIVE